MEVNKLREKHDIPGISVSIIHKGKIVNFTSGFHAKNDDSNAINPQTTFLGGSISKAFSASSALQYF